MCLELLQHAVFRSESDYGLGFLYCKIRSKEMSLSPEDALAELEQVVQRLVSENLALRLEKEALQQQLEEYARAQTACAPQSSTPTSAAELAKNDLNNSGTLVLSAVERLYFKERLQRLLELVDLELHRLSA
jgi:regulator of replication initiation timing